MLRQHYENFNNCIIKIFFQTTHLSAKTTNLRKLNRSILKPYLSLVKNDAGSILLNICKNNN
jgi:hypothetical protein